MYVVICYRATHMPITHLIMQIVHIDAKEVDTSEVLKLWCKRYGFRPEDMYAEAVETIEVSTL